MKDNWKWVILAAGLVLMECVYVYGTRWQHLHDNLIYNRLTGQSKLAW